MRRRRQLLHVLGSMAERQQFPAIGQLDRIVECAAPIGYGPVLILSCSARAKALALIRACSLVS
jgi:hypothetical protein